MIPNHYRPVQKVTIQFFYLIKQFKTFLPKDSANQPSLQQHSKTITRMWSVVTKLKYMQGQSHRSRMVKGGIW